MFSSGVEWLKCLWISVHENRAQSFDKGSSAGEVQKFGTPALVTEHHNYGAKLWKNQTAVFESDFIHPSTVNSQIVK